MKVATDVGRPAQRRRTPPGELTNFVKPSRAEDNPASWQELRGCAAQYNHPYAHAPPSRRATASADQRHGATACSWNAGVGEDIDLRKHGRAVRNLRQHRHGVRQANSIAARVLTKRISRELADELLANARCAATAIHIIEDAENRADPVFAAKARETMPLLLVNIHKDRFAQYFEHEKTTVYVIDRQGFLRDFYEASSHLKRALATDDITLIRLPCMLMIHYGKQYAEAHRQALPAIDDFWFKSYLAMPDDGTLPILE